MALRLQLRRWIGTASVLVLALCVAVAPVSATVLKLSSQTNQHDNVHAWQVSPNGQYVVYSADRLGDGSDEIYSVPITGGTPVRLNVTPEPPFQVGQYAISPDSQSVVYIVPQQSGQGLSTPAELFRVPTAGGTSVKLNGALVTGGSVSHFNISLDNSRVIYRADQEVDNVYELYSVPLNASALPVKLNKSLVADGDVSTVFRITSDSSRVVYIADQDTNDEDELYSVPVAGPASSGIKLNPPLVSDGDVGFQPASAYFTLSPDGTRVVYYADQDTDGQVELYSAQTTLAASGIKLNNPIQAGGVLSPGSASISGNGSRVIFLARLESSAIYHSLYSVPIDGPASASIRLNDPAIVSSSVYGSSIIADSSRVIFYAYPPTPGEFTVYSVPLAGPASAVITLTTSAETYQISPNGQHLIFHTGYVGGSLYSVPTNGPAEAAVRLNALGSAGPLAYRLSPANTRVVYQGSAVITGTRELYSVPITGPYTDSVKISGPLVSGGNVEYYDGFAFTPDGQRVVYRADAETDGKIELYVTDEGNLVSNKVYLPLVIR